jgi:ABC-type uncharacterized transport system ATPase subunit
MTRMVAAHSTAVGAGDPAMVGSPPAAIAAHSIWKTYGRVVANRNVSIAVRPGTVHAVLGENGAGKSTLMKILYGAETPDRGTIMVGGEQVRLRGPRDAIALGVGMVFQHFGLVPSLTAAENVALGVEPRRGVAIDRAAVRDQLKRVSADAGLDVNPDERVGAMSAARQQRVEILKALFRGARTLILDEPTALLTPQERRGLYGAIRTLAAGGATIVLITHKLGEVEELADDVTVMRTGEVVASGPYERFTHADLVRHMVGDVSVSARRTRATPGDVVLSATDVAVTRRGAAAVSVPALHVRAGEIVGLAGVEGNGQLDLVDALAGLRPGGRGTLTVAGRAHDLARLDNRTARRAGIGYVPEDRLAAGIAPDESVAANLVAATVATGAFQRGGLLSRRAIRTRAEELVREYGVRCRDVGQRVGDLSGGNIQKVLLARELAAGPRALLVAEPTRGLDIAAAALIHERLAAAAEAGTALLVQSSDLEELLTITTRILVLYRGAIAADLPNTPRLTAERLGELMLGAA